jgi:tRNA modification GTPase
MDRAHQALDRADIVLFVVDATAGVSPEEMAVFDRILPKPCFVAANKSDLPGAEAFFPPAAWAEAAAVVRISALHGQGINELKTLLADRARAQLPARNTGAFFNPRHRAALLSCREAVVNAIAGLKSGVPADMVAMDVQDAVRRLDEMTGEGAGRDVLDAVFGRFCVGK